MNGDCNICINGKLPSYSASCVECGLLRKNYKPMTNADRIRSMSDEELANFIGYACQDAFAYGAGLRNKMLIYPFGTREETLGWLKSQVVEVQDGT